MVIILTEKLGQKLIALIKFYSKDRENYLNREKLTLPLWVEDVIAFLRLVDIY